MTGQLVPAQLAELGDRQSGIEQVGWLLAGIVVLAEDGHDPLDLGLGFRPLMRSRLTREERLALAYIGVSSLDEDQAAELVGTIAQALGGAGAPLPAFGDLADDARLWASTASLAELKAYGWHAFLALPERSKRDFVAAARRHLEPEVAA